MEYIPIIVAVLLGLLLLMTCIYCIRVFRSANAQRSAIIDEIEHLVPDGCTDPVDAIHRVRKWIIRHYGNAGSYSMWRENAYAVMNTWLRSVVANRMGISNIRYIHGMYSESSYEKSWLEFDYAGSMSMIVDLDRGVASQVCQGGAVTHIEDVATDPVYVISSHSEDYTRYHGKAGVFTPNYTLI